MKKSLLIPFIIYLFAVMAAGVYLPVKFGFSAEYVMLIIQAVLVVTFFLFQKAKESPKFSNEISLAISALFVGILYYATFHLLILVLSAIIVAGWFWYLKDSGSKN